MLDSCSESEVCPKYERDNKNGKDDVCIHCEYIRGERKKVGMLRVIFVLVFCTFLVSTYVNFS